MRVEIPWQRPHEAAVRAGAAKSENAKKATLSEDLATFRATAGALQLTVEGLEAEHKVVQSGT